MEEQMAQMQQELKQLKAKNEQLERKAKASAVTRRHGKKFATVNVTGTTIKQQRFYSKLKARHQLLPSLLALVNSLATPNKDIYEVRPEVSTYKIHQSTSITPVSAAFGLVKPMPFRSLVSSRARAWWSSRVSSKISAPCTVSIHSLASQRRQKASSFQTRAGNRAATARSRRWKSATSARLQTSSVGASAPPHPKWLHERRFTKAILMTHSPIIWFVACPSSLL